MALRQRSAVVIVLLILVACLVYVGRRDAPRGRASTVVVADGDAFVLPRLQGEYVWILGATYAPAEPPSLSCESYDVTARLRAWAAAQATKHDAPTQSHRPRFVVNPAAFPGAPPCAARRQLTVEFRCEPQRPRPARERVIPRRVDTCSSAQDVLPAAMADPDPALHRWAGPDNHNWTVAVTPWDPDSRIQLSAAALTPGARAAHRPINPLTRIGATDRVPNWGNPFNAGDISSSPCSSAVSVYQVQPFQPGFLIPRANDSTDGTPMEGRYYYQPEYWSRASGPYGGPYTPVATCPTEETKSRAGAHRSHMRSRGGNAGRGVPAAGGAHGGTFWWQQAGSAAGPRPSDLGRPARDLAELVGITIGPYAASAKARAADVTSMRAFVQPKETLRSEGNTRAAATADQCLTGVGCGLGSTWIDSRFEPGPQQMYCGGDAIWAHGGHAGGPTFGSYTPYVFQTSGTWDRYVHGFGDGHYVAPAGAP